MKAERILCQIVTFLTTVGLFFVHSTYAGELRIIDQQGLVRAVKASSAPEQVIVQTSPKVAADGELKLSAIDGISPDLIAKKVDGYYEFSQVQQGTWQIKGSILPKYILSVQIKD